MNKFVTFSVALIAIAAVVVYSEKCHTYNDCHTTGCPSNSSHVSCQHGTCTCLTHVSCMTAADCSDQAMCHDRHAHYHCVDLRCLCLKDEHVDEGDRP